MRTIIIDRELQPYMAIEQGKTHNGTEVVTVANTVKDLKKYNKGSIKWFVDRLNLTQVGNYFIGDTKLTEMVISARLPMLSDARGMFCACIGLERVTLPEELPMLSDASGMFYNCKCLKKATLPKELPLLGDAKGMFEYCTSLTEITLSKKLPKLSEVSYMFRGCTSLRKVTMSKEVYDKFHTEMFDDLDESKIEFIFY